MISRGLYMCDRDDHQDIITESYAEGDVTTYQERISSDLMKMWQRVRNILQVTCRRFYNVSGTSCKLLGEDVTTYQEHHSSYLKKMWQRVRNVLQVTVLAEDFTTYQERVESHLKKMLQRIRNIWQVTWRRVYTSPAPPSVTLKGLYPTWLTLKVEVHISKCRPKWMKKSS